MKQYKRKRHLEANSLDIKPRKLGIKLEGSERERAKKEIRKELQEYNGKDSHKEHR